MTKFKKKIQKVASKGVFEERIESIIDEDGRLGAMLTYEESLQREGHQGDSPGFIEIEFNASYPDYVGVVSVELLERLRAVCHAEDADVSISWIDGEPLLLITIHGIHRWGEIPYG